MSRPRMFQSEEVLDKAMAVFWRQGFERTSMKDLTEATGLNPGSLYGAFGDKQGLFLAAVDRYTGPVVEARLRILKGSGTPLERLRAFFESGIAASEGDGAGLGCLLTNTAVERGPVCAETKRRLVAARQRMEAALADVIAQGCADGSFLHDAARASPDAGSEAGLGVSRTPEQIAQFFYVMLQGLRVMARTGTSGAALRDVVTTALSVLVVGTPSLNETPASQAAGDEVLSYSPLPEDHTTGDQ